MNLHPSVIFGATVSSEAVTSPLAISKAVWPQSLVIEGPRTREGGFRIMPCAETAVVRDNKESTSEGIVQVRFSKVLIICNGKD